MFEELVKSVIEELSNSPKITIYCIKIDTPTSDLVTDNIVEFRKSINQNKLNLILDIDGTIIDANLNDYLILRPHYTDLFEFCLNNQISTYLWTCGETEHANRVIDAINGSRYLSKVLCRGNSWYDNVYTIKKLRWLSRKINNILLIDNTLQMSTGQCDNTIIIPTFEAINIWSYKVNKDAFDDDKLVKLIDFLIGLIGSEKNVPEYLNSHLELTTNKDSYRTLKYHTI